MRYQERQAGTEDTQWLWSLYVDLLKPYVSMQWGWQQRYQEEMFATHLPASQFRILTSTSTRVAAYLMNREADHFYLKMLLVTGDRQRQGLGKMIVRKLQQQANQESLPLKLSVIKANPVVEFYTRLGFTVYAEDNDSTSLIYQPRVK